MYFLDVLPWESPVRHGNKLTITLFPLTLLATVSSVWGACNLPAAQPNGPAIPILPTSYKVLVEANILYSNYTMDMEEYFDDPGNRGMLRFIKNGYEGRVIYNYDTNETYSIVGGVCSVSSLTAGPRSTLFGVDITDGREHISSASSAFSFGQQSQPSYQGQTTVRGITVDHWTACLQGNFGDLVNSNLTANFYFSVPSWNTSTNYHAVPVRAEVQGNATRNGVQIPVHNLYDLHRFETPGDFDSMTFEVPSGIVCPGRVNSKSIPTLQNSYYFRQEQTFSDSYISQADVWYDYNFKLMRIDHRPIEESPPYYTTDPLTEIHDFSQGVRYVIDQASGNCTAYPINNGSLDSRIDLKALKANGSYILDMRNAVQFLFLDTNFTYTGQRTVRDAACDVYIGQRSNFPLSGRVNTANVTLEYYFLSDEWLNIPTAYYSSSGTGFPMKLEVYADQLDYRASYNFYDFAFGDPDVSAWDISKCFRDDQKLSFRLRMPGQFKRDTQAKLRRKAHSVIAENMGVSPLRIQGVQVDYDTNSVFISSTLLGPTPATVQFTLVPSSEILHQDDKVWPAVASWQECAGLCVNNPDFVCNSFDLCPGSNNVTLVCQLSKAHIGDGNATVVHSVCNHYSRTVQGTQPEKTIDAAYGDFEQRVYTHMMEIDIDEDDESEADYVAISTEITLGWTEPTKPIPSLSGQFSYQAEVTIPSQQATYNLRVWYDTNYNLARYDFRSHVPVPPFYSIYTLSTIHDFNSGIGYTIDQVMRNCTMGPISPGSSGDAVSSGAAAMQSGNEFIRMKGPLEMFSLDNTYNYTGQRTIRGMTCDVFESLRTDYYAPGSNTSSHAIFQFFFQSSEWSDTADTALDVTVSAPVQLNIMAIDSYVFEIITFTDFSDKDPDLSVFDITPCFDDSEEVKHFMLSFDKPFHPYLDDRKYMFQVQTALMLAQITRISPIRFQRVSVDYNFNNVYVTVTLLGKPDYITYFYHTNIKTKPYNAAYFQMNATGPDECAMQCLTNANMICNSFDFCSFQGLCMLSSQHVPDAASIVLPANISCDHYSRAVNGTLNTLNLPQAFLSIKDYTYLGLLKVVVTLDNNQTVTYTATDIRDDIVRNEPPKGSEGLYFKQFRLYQQSARLSTSDMYLTQVAVDDCATECIVQVSFICQSFSYSFNTGDCYVSRYHPADLSATIVNDTSYFLYSREYLDQYSKFDGQVPVISADSVQNAVTSQYDCARACSQSAIFDCKSFDYCPTQQSCRLRKTHVLTLTNATAGANYKCDHYSRNYLYDFKKMPKTVIVNNDDVVVTDVTVDDCAKMCVEQTDITCLSFEFCPNTTDCRLSGAHPLTSSVSTATSQYCSLYTQKTTSQLPVRSSGSQNTIAPGPMVGVAIAMLAVGVVLGVAVPYAIRRRKVMESYQMQKLS